MRRVLLQIYTKNREEAFAFYKDAFDAELGYCDKAEDGTVIHAELDIRGQSIAVGDLHDGAEQNIPGNTMQFCLQFEPGEEPVIRRAYEKMKEHGKIRALGLFFQPADDGPHHRYGVHWCLFIG